MTDGPSPHDPDFLHEHRAALLKGQGLSAEDFSTSVFGGATRRDLAVAVVYSILALGMGGWVIWVGKEVGHGLLAVMLFLVVLVFVLQFWSNFITSRRKALRGRAYEGVLEAKDGGAVFQGGRVSLPPRIMKELVPGVRYRIHAAGTDEVAVDVAIDEDEKKRGAYR